MSEEHKAPDVITFDDFLKVDIRVGRIIAAERILKSEKLLKLQVDLGELGIRTILAGIAKDYPPEHIIDRNVLVVVNLAPRKMMGIESHGMLLAGSLSDNGVELAMAPLCTPGTRIG